jgi:hypothetical protein
MGDGFARARAYCSLRWEKAWILYNLLQLVGCPEWGHSR